MVGRHRNRALAEARKVRPVELSTAGASYTAIAVDIGYANGGTAY